MTKFIEKSKLIMERIKESSNIDFEVDDVFYIVIWFDGYKLLMLLLVYYVKNIMILFLFKWFDCLII